MSCKIQFAKLVDVYTNTEWERIKLELKGKTVPYKKEIPPCLGWPYQKKDDLGAPCISDNSSWLGIFNNFNEEILKKEETMFL